MSVELIGITKSVIPEASSAEELLAYIARVSNPKNQDNRSTANKLIKYLLKHKHFSPFEMVSLTVSINTTRDIARQVLRHRSFSFQEFSQRYAEVLQLPVLREARLQDLKNRQKSVSVEDDELQFAWNLRQNMVNNEARAAYIWALDNNIAKEQARSVLPEGNTPSHLYMAGTLRSFIHYIDVRSDAATTQLEHVRLAEDCKAIVVKEFPVLESYWEPDVV